MARFFFHLHEHGAALADEEGIELPDLAAARAKAVATARDIMSSEIRDGHLRLACRIDIEDAEGHPLMSVPFEDAIALTGV